MSSGTRLPSCDTLMQDLNHESLRDDCQASVSSHLNFQIPVPGDDWEPGHKEHHVSLPQWGGVMDQGHGRRSAKNIWLFIIEKITFFSWVSLQTIPKELPHLGCREGKTTKSQFNSHRIWCKHDSIFWWYINNTLGYQCPLWHAGKEQADGKRGCESCGGLLRELRLEILNVLRTVISSWIVN